MKWVVNARQKDTMALIIRLFAKCGTTNKLDGSQDDQVNIKGLEDHTMPLLALPMATMTIVIADIASYTVIVII